MNRDVLRMSIRLQIVMAAASAVLAVVSIFSRIEDATLGLLVWGVYLVAVGLAHTVVLISSGRRAGWWTWWIGHALVAVVIGVFTLSFQATGSVALLTWSIAVWSVIAGGSSLVQGFRQPRQTSLRSDWATVGGGTLFLGGLVMVVPAEVYWYLGLAGVWAAMVSVFLVIAVLSARTAMADENGEQEGNS